jgi:hypothetical protein
MASACVDFYGTLQAALLPNICDLKSSLVTAWCTTGLRGFLSTWLAYHDPCDKMIECASVYQLEPWPAVHRSADRLRNSIHWRTAAGAVETRSWLMDWERSWSGPYLTKQGSNYLDVACSRATRPCSQFDAALKTQQDWSILVITLLVSTALLKRLPDFNFCGPLRAVQACIDFYWTSKLCHFFAW